MRRIVQPGELDLSSPGRRDYLVALENDSLWGDHLIPLTVLVGPHATQGRGLVAFGATHGDEYEGPVALRHLMDELALDRVRGRIVLVPVLNPAAFRTGTRDSAGDDGVNLNRAFVPGAGRAPLGGITHRIAAFVRDAIWPQVDVVLDLHAGGQVARFAPCASFHEVPDPAQHRRIADTARGFGTPFVITYQNATVGLLTSEAEAMGKTAVGCELGWGGAVQAQGVAFARRGVLSAAILHGHYDAPAPPRHEPIWAEMVDRACFVPAPFAGLYEPLVECGAPIRAGDIAGWLHDFGRLDIPPCPIHAAHDGYVIAQAFGARVMQGQHILVVAKPSAR